MSYEDARIEPQAGRFVCEDGEFRNVVNNDGQIKVALVGGSSGASVAIDQTTDGVTNGVSLTTNISADVGDNIDVSKMSKGTVTTAHSAITATATSVEIDCRGFNAISVECAVSAITSGNWAIEVTGCAITGGTFGSIWDQNSRKCITENLNANGNYNLVYTGIPNYVKIVATRTTDGTLTAKVTPMNL